MSRLREMCWCLYKLGKTMSLKIRKGSGAVQNERKELIQQRLDPDAEFEKGRQVKEMRSPIMSNSPHSIKVIHWAHSQN